MAQKKLLVTLLRRGWTKADLGRALMARPATVSSWFGPNPSLAPPRLENKLKGLLDKDPPGVDYKAPMRGSLSESDRRARNKLERRHGLYTPRGRIKRLEGERARRGWTQMEMAIAIGVSLATYRRYLDDNNKDHISPEALNNIIRLIEEDIPGPTPLDRFNIAAKSIFGEYYSKPFPHRSNLKARVIAALADATGLTVRTIYRRLPQNQTTALPSIDVVEAFERVASELTGGSFVDRVKASQSTKESTKRRGRSATGRA